MCELDGIDAWIVDVSKVRFENLEVLSLNSNLHRIKVTGLISFHTDTSAVLERKARFSCYQGYGIITMRNQGSQ
jgi:hypothetical protein